MQQIVISGCGLIGNGIFGGRSHAQGLQLEAVISSVPNNFGTIGRVGEAQVRGL